MKTLEEGKDFLRENFDKGCTCPCCGQFVKLYKRKLNSGMARNLTRIYLESKDGKYIHVEDVLRKYKDHSGHDWALLRFWGLIEEIPNEMPSASNSSGMWKITYKGKQFVRNQISIPKRVHLYNNKFFSFSKETTTIVGALGDKFDYQQLINS